MKEDAVVPAPPAAVAGAEAPPNWLALDPAAMKPKEPPPGVKPPPVDAAGATAAAAVAAEDADGLTENAGAAALAGAPPKLKAPPVEAAALEAAAVNKAGCEEAVAAPGADMKLKPPP